MLMKKICVPTVECHRRRRRRRRATKFFFVKKMEATVNQFSSFRFMLLLFHFYDHFNVCTMHA